MKILLVYKMLLTYIYHTFHVNLWGTILFSCDAVGQFLGLVCELDDLGYC